MHITKINNSNNTTCIAKFTPDEGQRVARWYIFIPNIQIWYVLPSLAMKSFEFFVYFWYFTQCAKNAFTFRLRHKLMAYKKLTSACFC
jgi:hypothetical protein